MLGKNNTMQVHVLLKTCIVGGIWLGLSVKMFTNKISVISCFQSDQLSQDTGIHINRGDWGSRLKEEGEYDETNLLKPCPVGKTRCAKHTIKAIKTVAEKYGLQENKTYIATYCIEKVSQEDFSTFHQGYNKNHPQWNYDMKNGCYSSFGDPELNVHPVTPISKLCICRADGCNTIENNETNQNDMILISVSEELARKLATFLKAFLMPSDRKKK